MTPFGEDITNPDARVIPPQFHGEWVRDPSDCHNAASSSREIIAAETMTLGNDVQRVVAVRFISDLQIAVVTQPVTGEEDYGLYYRGVSEDGSRLTDLENMDFVLQRCPAS